MSIHRLGAASSKFTANCDFDIAMKPNLAMLKNLMSDLRRPKISKREAKRRQALYYEKIFSEALSSGGTLGEVAGYPGTAINTTDENEFRAHLKVIDNDLEEIIKIFHEGVLHYFQHGDYPAPYYAWRIAVILRKNKLYQEETDFLAAFSKLFSDGNGKRYEDIAKRIPKAEKTGGKTQTDLTTHDEILPP